MLCIISKDTFGDCAVRSIQTNSGWNENPYENYAVVPERMIDSILATKGFCDIVLNDNGSEVVSFEAREAPEIPEPEQPISEIEQLRADIDYIALMKGVDL